MTYWACFLFIAYKHKTNYGGTATLGYQDSPGAAPCYRREKLNDITRREGGRGGASSQSYEKGHQSKAFSST